MSFSIDIELTAEEITAYFSITVALFTAAFDYPAWTVYYMGMAILLIINEHDKKMDSRPWCN